MDFLGEVRSKSVEDLQEKPDSKRESNTAPIPEVKVWFNSMELSK